MHGLLLTQDLMLPSRIVPAATALGIQLQVASSPAAAPHGAGWAVVILDLDLPDAAPEQLAQREDFAGAGLLAYGSHVAREQLKRAADAGFLVVPRSQMSAQTTDVLRQVLNANQE